MDNDSVEVTVSNYDEATLSGDPVIFYGITRDEDSREIAFTVKKEDGAGWMAAGVDSGAEHSYTVPAYRILPDVDSGTKIPSFQEVADQFMASVPDKIVPVISETERALLMAIGQTAQASVDLQIARKSSDDIFEEAQAFRLAEQNMLRCLENALEAAVKGVLPA